jgi:hypothetical protein
MKWYAHLIGFGFPVVVGVLIMNNLVTRLWDCIIVHGSSDPKLRPESWQPRVLAFLESILYIAFLQMGQAWFIGLWMALKVAGQWTRWSARGDAATNQPPGPVVFNVFMIGNGLLILFSYVGFKLIGWVHHEQWLRVLWAPGLIVGLTLAFYMWLARYRKLPSAAEAAKS